jgi:hypothetical protein
VTVKVIPENRSKIEAAFWQFHEQNPLVYDELVRLARQLRSQGWERFSIKMLLEVVRYRSMLGNTQGKGPRINNNHGAHYSRLIAEQEPDLADVFKTRRLGVPSHLVP